jgi:hypothetical protein
MLKLTNALAFVCLVGFIIIVLLELIVFTISREDRGNQCCDHEKKINVLRLEIADSLAEWFEVGDGHQVWRLVHLEHPHLLEPPLIKRSKVRMAATASRKRARSAGPADGGMHNHHGDHITSSKARQHQAAYKKTLRDALLYV